MPTRKTAQIRTQEKYKFIFSSNHGNRKSHTGGATSYMTASIVILMALLLIFPVKLARAETKVFSNWQVSCDPYANCAATTTPTVGSLRGLPTDYVLQIARQPYETYWEISFTSHLALPVDAGAFIVTIDDAVTSLSAPEEFAAFDALNSYYLYGDKVQAIMDQLTPGETISVQFTSEHGSIEASTFSLAGLTAALLWIDEQQGRIGSERVAKAPPVNKQRVTTRNPEPISDTLLARHAANIECEPADQLANGADQWSFRMSATQTVHILPCWSAAYNFGWMVYVQGEYETRQQYFAFPSQAGGWMASADLTNASYDERTLTLSSFAKGRGLGDCGTSGLWQWDGYSFALLEFSAKYACDEEGYPGEFPVIYRAPNYQPGEGY